MSDQEFVLLKALECAADEIAALRAERDEWRRRAVIAEAKLPLPFTDPDPTPLTREEVMGE